MEYIKVKDEPNLVRDPHSKAIINLNREAINRYNRERALIEKNKHQESEIESLKTEMGEIKELLKQLLGVN